MKFDLTWGELKYIHDMILSQRLLDPKRRKKLDAISNKIIGQMESIEQAEVIKREDQEDDKYRKEIVNETTQ